MNVRLRALFNLYDREFGPAAALASALLAPAGILYAGAMALRREGYRRGILPSASAPCRVVSVGGLTAGGSGKTQVVAFLSQETARRRMAGAVVHGAYGGSLRGSGGVVRVTPTSDPAFCGDEALMLATLPGGVPVYASRDRLAACRLACDDMGASVCVLDDGAQHLGISRDCNVVVLDASSPFGNGRCLPAGPLREPPRALGGAHVVWFVSHDGRGSSTAVLDRVHALNPALRFVRSRSVPEAIEYPAAGVLPPGTVEGARVFAFCGIARPHRFFDAVRALGPSSLDTRAFADHHPYAPADASSLAAAARAAGADLILTTAKDHARSSAVLSASVKYAVIRTRLEITFGGDEIGRILGAEAAGHVPVR
ncbi:MAG: tetraacyldisaccharide 4'-kinase [Deltaproteobacteria bacterium]|nr:tetraacyldisaccharide 4'-kinase [Deltaproteobacteria bacterium]